MSFNIVGICGHISSGKDTIAEYLVNNYGFKRESFANSLKDAISCIFGWDRNLLEGTTVESRKWREQVDPWWANRLGIPHLTPRWILQNWGTEVCRHSFHDDIWIASLEHKIQNIGQNIVVTDCRFPNEIKTLRNAHAKMICVERGKKPEWYHYAFAINTRQGNQNELKYFRDKLDSYLIHDSEWAWIGTNFDAIFDNDSTIDELYKNVDQFIRQG